MSCIIYSIKWSNICFIIVYRVLPNRIFTFFNIPYDCRISMMPMKRSRFSPRWFLAGMPPHTLSTPIPYISSFAFTPTFELLASAPEGRACGRWSSTVDWLEYRMPSVVVTEMKVFFIIDKGKLQSNLISQLKMCMNWWK